MSHSDTAGGLPMTEFTNAMANSITRTPECLLTTTSELGLVAVKGFRQGLTATELTASTFEDPYLEDLVWRTIDAHTKIERQLRPPAIDNANLRRQLPMFYRFSTHGLVRAVAQLSRGDVGVLYGKLGDATPEEIATADAYLGETQNIDTIEALLASNVKALASQPASRYVGRYRSALLGTSSDEFPVPLTAWQRLDRRNKSLPHTDLLKERLKVLVSMPLEAAASKVGERHGLSQRTVATFVGNVILP